MSIICTCDLSPNWKKENRLLLTRVVYHAQQKPYNKQARDLILYGIRDCNVQ